MVKPNVDDFNHLRHNPVESLDLARAICEREGISSVISRLTGGSQLLFSLGDARVLKVFPSNEAAFCHTEALFLGQLYGMLPVPTPRLYQSDCCDGYPYLIMDAMQGTPLVQVWKSLSDEERHKIIGQIGQTARALHSLPTSRFLNAATEWHSFIEDQRVNLAVHHRNYGLDQRWIPDVTAYVSSVQMDFHDSSQLVPLHTELMLEHIFVQKHDGDWLLSGLIDFEPSMVGLRDYEFCSVGLFLSQGNCDLFRTFLLSYGLTEEELTAAFSQRLMTLLLLHRYCNLKWFLSRVPESFSSGGCVELERYWFSC